jgi:hypothetical protein
VPAARLLQWLGGAEQVPLQAFMHVLDLIAAGPFREYQPERRRVRGMANARMGEDVRL